MGGPKRSDKKKEENKQQFFQVFLRDFFQLSSWIIKVTLFDFRIKFSHDFQIKSPKSNYL